MKKNYIKPVSKTVIAEMDAIAQDVIIASQEKIENGGDDNEGLDPEVRERYKGFTDESSSSYSLW